MCIKKNAKGAMLEKINRRICAKRKNMADGAKKCAFARE